jgi:integrase
MRARKVEHNGVSRWKVEYTENGKRKRKFFTTKAEAELVIAKKKAREKRLGSTTASMLGDEMLQEVAGHIKSLEKYNATLREAVEAFIKRAKASASSRPVSDLVKLYIKRLTKDGKSASHIAKQDSRLLSLVEFIGSDTLASDVDTEVANEWLDSLDVSPNTRLAYRTAGHAFYEHILATYTRKKVAQDNPFHKAAKPKRVAPEVGIFTPSQMAQLLTKAEATSPKLLAWVAIGGFAGLRPSEIERLDWQHINFEKKRITVHPTRTSKESHRRSVDMSDALCEWLEKIRLIAGPVATASYSTSKALKEFRKGLKFDWPYDGLRHSYGTYHLYAFEDAGKTSLQMGHKGNPRMLHNHYKSDAVEREDAMAWWGLQPDEAKKVAKKKRAVSR